MCIMSFSPHSHPKSQTLRENEDGKSLLPYPNYTANTDRAGILYLTLGV